MMRRLGATGVIAVGGLLVAEAGYAETPLKVVVTIAREAPGRRPASESLELHMVTGRSAVLKAKPETPIAVQGSLQYRAVGTDLECRASEAGAGRYLVETKVSHGPMYRLPAAGTGPPGPGSLFAEMPLFRTVEATVSSIYRDGQTSSPVVARDPVSGEVSRVSVTVTRMR